MSFLHSNLTNPNLINCHLLRNEDLPARSPFDFEQNGVWLRFLDRIIVMYIRLALRWEQRRSRRKTNARGKNRVNGHRRDKEAL